MTSKPKDPRYQTKGKRITPKQKVFAEEFVKTRNATESAMRVYDTNDRKIAQNIGSENLAKPIIRREIEALLLKNGVRIDDILGIHSRNMLQDVHLPTSQKAVGDFYEILGMKSQDKPSGDVKIAFVISK